MYTIGEFSRITGLSIKALRLYHERELLIPSSVDTQTGYRYYDHANVEKARIITYLRGMEFSLSDISRMVEGADQADVVGFFEAHKAEINSKINRQKNIIRLLEDIIKTEKEAIMTLQNADFEVEEKDLDTMLIAGIRFKGRYEDCGPMFGKIAKAMGSNLYGKPFNLYYDEEFKEDDADIESCFPVRRGKNVEGISVRELAGGRCVSLIHKGSYDTISRSYEKITKYLKEHGFQWILPSREIYLKGPGMVFKGKPENYLTEIQVLI